MKDILNKRSVVAISKDDQGLFSAISKAFDDLSQQVEAFHNNRSEKELTSIFNLEMALSDIFKMLENQEAPVMGTPPDLYQLAEYANKIKGLITERIRKERQLIEEVSHLKTIQAIAKAGSWEVELTEGIDSKQHYWSDELFNILNIEPGSIEYTYHNYLALIHPDDRGLFEREVNRAIKSKSMYDIEYRIVWKNGMERVVRDVGHTIGDHTTGTLVKMVGVTFDITEIKKTEHALSRANNELHTLFNTMQETFWSADVVTNKLLQMSPACKQVYGYEAEEMKNDPDLWFKVILDEDKPLVQSEIPRLASGQVSRNEYRIRHKDGGVRWLEARVTPTLNIEGKLIRLDGIQSDITARKEAETALKSNELKFRSLIQNAHDVITIANDSLRFSFVSESMTGMTGFPPEEMFNKSILEYIHPEHHAAVQEMLVPLSEHPGKPVHFEFQFRTKNGKWIWTEGQVTNLLQEAAVGGYVANFRDITERKNYERSLEIANEELKKSNHELDRFVYSVSHDLRAPLASILGLLEYSQTETDNEELLENMELMKRSVEKLDIFILDILDYSRNARVELKKERIDFRELLAEVSSSLKFMSLGKSNVQMRINIQENSAFYSDRGRILVVLNNLVSNAMRYCNPDIPDPYVEVSVNFNSQGASVAVRDNGIGVDKKYHQRIFDMFFRVSDKSTGSGLGLYLVKETIDKLHGSLEFISAPGCGTEFKIFLPNLETALTDGRKKI